MVDNENIEEEEIIKGDPWSVLPVKTRKFAKDCKEIVLSRRRINKLINFEMFENLEALWWTDNRLTEIKGWETNFRIKILCFSQNLIVSLDNSGINKMKFLEVLYLDHNKLKNLEKVLAYLKQFSFLKNWNWLANPVAEEAEYRPRVVDSLKSLEIFDRRKITKIERIKDEQIVKEYYYPLSKGKASRPYRPKVYENYSVTEKELSREARAILKRDFDLEQEKKKIQNEVIEREKFPSNYIPYNKIINKNMEQYYDKKISPCSELDDNEMNRWFNKYDPAKTGMFKRGDIQMLFFDIKELLEKRNVEFNENKLINLMLDFYAKASELITKDDIKKCYGKIWHEHKANMWKDKVWISDLDYWTKLANDGKEVEKSKTVPVKSQCTRNDVFQIKCITDKKRREVILNENKLEKMYQTP